MSNGCFPWGQPKIKTSGEKDIFKPIHSAMVVPTEIPQFPNHPIAPKGVLDDPRLPIHTNKFYANWLFGEQTAPVWTHPYSLVVEQGWKPALNWGMGITHTEAKDVRLADGPPPVQFYINPLSSSITLSAKELRDRTRLTTESLSAFFVMANLTTGGDRPPVISFPCYQGMGFVTAIYHNATPNIQSKKLYKKIDSPIPFDVGLKYRLTLDDDTAWIMYVIPSEGYDPSSFRLEDTGNFVGAPNFNGTIQIAKNPSGADGEAIYDKAAGSYARKIRLGACVHPDGASSKYVLYYSDKVGDTPLLIFALPHHMDSLDGRTSSCKTNLKLRTTTKGMATGLLTDALGMMETYLPVDMGFAPWTPGRGDMTHIPDDAWPAVNLALERELPFPPSGKLESMYHTGKSLAKYASTVWVAYQIVREPNIALQSLNSLKTVFLRFVKNWQTNSLVYDTKWKGVVESLGYRQGKDAEFGNTKYNDHHFTWGYWVYTAAVIATCDPNWLRDGTNFEWVQMLVKDFANSDQGPESGYPFFRAFDWYHGHSWAKGLFQADDGKEEESTSEDGFASYAMKLWGRAIGDSNMEARGKSPDSPTPNPNPTRN